MFERFDNARLNFYWTEWHLSDGRAISCQMSREHAGLIQRVILRILEYFNRKNARKYERLYNNLSRFLGEMRVDGD